MKNWKWRIGVMDAVPAILAAAFFLGVLTFLGACPASEDGSWMTCHWAGMSLRGAAGALAALEILHALPIGAERKQGLDMAAVIVSGLAALLPGRLISLCMMSTMRCHTVMAPSAAVFAALIAAASAADFAAQSWRIRKGRVAERSGHAQHEEKLDEKEQDEEKRDEI